MTLPAEATRNAALLRRGRGLEAATLAWNLVGIVILAVAALRAHSVALAGFGLDSLIEIGASTVVLWELSGTGEERQRRALRLIAAAARSPLALAWLAGRRARTLVGRNETLGIEAVLVRGILWRYLIVLRTMGRQRPGGSEEDASVPSPVPQKLVPRQRRWLARR